MSSCSARPTAATLLALALALAFSVGAPAVAQAPTSSIDTPRGIRIQYADGQTTTRSAYTPETRSVSAQLDIRTEPVGSNVSAYRVVLKNRSRVALMWVSLKAYRGDRVALSGLPRGKRNLPLVLPNAEYATELTPSSGGRGGAEGPDAGQPYDRVEVSALMWQDGLVEGDKDTAEQQRRFDEGRGESLRRLLAVLSGASRLPLPALRATLTPAIGFDAEIKQAGEEMLADVDALERTHRSQRGEGFEAWLARTRADNQEWLARIVLPKS